MTDYLLYWKPETVDYELAQNVLLNHAASNQLKHVQPGDTVWIATVRSGSLKLIGHLQVGLVTDGPNAMDLLGVEDLWEADYHLIAREGATEPMREIAIDDLASSLRFISQSNRDRLLIQDGCVNPQQLQSMRKLQPETAELLLRVWQARVDYEDITLAEEVSTPETLYEGSVRQISVNAYERNPVARRSCVAYYGTKCVVCGFDFEVVYGDLGAGFIHIHHLRELSKIGAEYQVDPIRDLRPVCANCHAMLHRRRPAYSIEEVRERVRSPQAAVHE